MPKIMKRLNIISRSQSLYRQRCTEREGIGELTPAQHTLTLAICRAPGRSQDELAKELCLNKSTVTRAISALVDSGYVRREPNELDRRELLIYPTEKMLHALPLVRKIARDWAELILAGLTEEEIAGFEVILSKIEENAKCAISGEVDK